MPLKSKKSKPKRRREEEDEEDDDVLDDDDEYEEEDDEDEEEAPPKSKKSKQQVKKKKASRVVEDDDDEEDEDEEADEDDDDDEPPKRKKTAKKSSSKKRKVDDDDDEDEDEEEGDEDEEEDDEEPVKKSGKKGSWFSSSADAFSKPAGGSDDRIAFEPDTEIDIIFASDKSFSFHRHYLGQGRGKGYRTCLREGCPLCAANNKATVAGAFHVFQVKQRKGEYTLTPGIVIEGTRFGKKFEKLKAKRGTLTGIIYGVTKTGSRQETEWEFEYKDKIKLTKLQQKQAQNPAVDFYQKFKPESLKQLKKLAGGIEADGEDDF